VKSGTVAENHLWRIKVYAPPREHGAPHVHVIAKNQHAEVKIFLETLEVVGRTRFSKKAVKEIIEFVHSNFEELMDAWEKLHGKKKKTKS